MLPGPVSTILASGAADMMIGRLLLFGLFLGAASAAYAREAVPALGVDEYIRREMEKRRTPGLAVAVVKDGKLAFAKGYGHASLELPVAVGPETVFQTASLGKQFTATAVMMLVEQGRIDLDERVGRYLGAVPASWNDMTVRHLLTHTSGLGGYPDDFDYRRDYSEDELLTIVQARPPSFSPGEYWQYSNAGYLTLGVLIRKVSGKFYGDFFQDHIFKPLGMKTARLINELVIIPNRAAGYVVHEGTIYNQPWMSHTVNRTADGSLYMTVMDLARWDAALYGERLLKRESLAQMWTPVTLEDGTKAPYGFGWNVVDANGHRLVEHEGAWQGFNAHIARYVDDNLTVIVLANLKSARAPMIAHGVAGIYLPAVAPRYYSVIEDREPKVTALATGLMDALAQGKADESQFTEDARAVFFPGKARMYETYLRSAGRRGKVELVERSDTPAGRVYRWEFFYDDVILLVSLTLDRNGRITEFESVDNY